MMPQLAIPSDAVQDHVQIHLLNEGHTALLMHFERFFTFLDHEGVEPTNNSAERALRSAPTTHVSQQSGLVPRPWPFKEFLGGMMDGTRNGQGRRHKTAYDGNLEMFLGGSSSTDRVFKDAPMQNLEPAVYRQRLIIEAHYSTFLDENSIRKYLNELSIILKMRVFAGPFSWPPDDRSHPEVPLNELNGFVAWTESGCHVYAWRFCRFFTADIYSCKQFAAETVVDFTRAFLRSNDLVYLQL
jgi:hypothetical protein